jgi:hypothetical protein
VVCTALITLATIAYTIIASVTLKMLNESNSIARDTFNAANRPYVGLYGLRVDHSGFHADGQLFSVPRRAKDTTQMNVTAEIKNFGQVPALNTNIDWMVYIDGVAVPRDPKIGTGLMTDFPGQTNLLSGTVGSHDYLSILNGDKVMDIDITVSYDWPGHHHQECSRSRFLPRLNGFAATGPCSGFDLAGGVLKR